mgnify:CR=1 FL=1
MSTSPEVQAFLEKVNARDSVTNAAHQILEREEAVRADAMAELIGMLNTFATELIAANKPASIVNKSEKKEYWFNNDGANFVIKFARGTTKIISMQKDSLLVKFTVIFLPGGHKWNLENETIDGKSQFTTSEIALLLLNETIDKKLFVKR